MTNPSYTDEQVREIADIVLAVGAEIDGGELPCASTGDPGYGASFIFDEKQLMAFVDAVRAKAKERFNPWPNRREDNFDYLGRRYVVVTDRENGIHFVASIYQLVKPAKGPHMIRRKVWPSNPVPASIRYVLAELGADKNGVISRATPNETKETGHGDDA